MALSTASTLLSSLILSQVPNEPPEPHRPQPSTLEVSIGGGAYMPATSPQPLNVESETGLSVGFRLAYLPVTYVGAELEAIHLSSRLGITDDGGYAVRGHLIGQYPGRLTPFVMLGAGVLGRPSETDPDTAPTLHWGGGLRWYTHPNVNFRVEARHVFAMHDSGIRQDLEAMVGFGFALFPEREASVVINDRAGGRGLAGVRN